MTDRTVTTCDHCGVEKPPSRAMCEEQWLGVDDGVSNLDFCSRSCLAAWARPSEPEPVEDLSLRQEAQHQAVTGMYVDHDEPADICDTSPGRWWDGRGIGFRTRR